MNKVALITGTTDQDGAYLAEFLLGKVSVVHGLKRRSSSLNTARVGHLSVDPPDDNVQFLMHYGDMTDATKARERLGWRYRIGFDVLVKDMVDWDMEVVAREQRGDVG